MERLRRILDLLDDLGMVAIVSMYYFGQDERLVNEGALRNGIDHAVGWILDQGYTNDRNQQRVRHRQLGSRDQPRARKEAGRRPEPRWSRYEHKILGPDRVHELIEHARKITRGGRLYVGTSYRGGMIPSEKVVAVSDIVLLHGNGTPTPAHIAKEVAHVKALPTYRPMPIVFNEDDHTGFDDPTNDMIAAVEQHASWGFYDPG